MQRFWDRKTLKERAKNLLRFTFWRTLATIAIEGAIIGAAVSLLTMPFVFITVFSTLDMAFSGVDSAAGYVFVILGIILLMTALIFLAVIFISGPLEVGRCRFLTACRYGDNSIKNLFFSFKSGIYMKTVKVMMFRNLKLFGWSLLYSLPIAVLGLLLGLTIGFADMGAMPALGILLGILIFLAYIFMLIMIVRKSISYFMVPHIVAENPNIESRRVFEISNRATKGEIGDIFVLGLSFIGWLMLASIVAMPLTFIVGPFSAIATFTVLVYIHATSAELYGALRFKSAMLGIVKKEEIGIEHFNAQS
ncbi:MAG: DUF975 family protein [Ruminococcaceae bacterium]|nr:DUF975 family protein [Oscillospiraceae bacterium]